MTKGHGRTSEYQVGEDLFIESLSPNRRVQVAESAGLALNANALTADKSDNPADLRFRYGRMFRVPNLPEFRPESQGLIALGQSMFETKVGEKSAIPAGYVYFGQFVDHDLSFDEKTKEMPVGIMKAEDALTLRSPTLDLDSLYGYAPKVTQQTDFGKLVYDDAVRLRVGETQLESSELITSKFPLTMKKFPNDLPRCGDPKKKQCAATIDARNDENLAVAQTHVAFIKFHNAVVQYLSDKVLGTELFDAARETVVKHYQWIILKDYLPTIIEKDVLNDVLEGGCKHFTFEQDVPAFMPIEFSVGAFRMGHAMVNETYDWNVVFQAAKPGLQAAHLFKDLFVFTGFGHANLLAQINVSSSWVMDWTRFYNFEGFADIEPQKPFNFARKIGPSVVPPLMNLPPIPGEKEPYLRVLPVRTLLRSRLLGVPAGQTVAERIGIQVLTAKEISAGPHQAVLEQFGLNQFTPLWYYILKEAEICHQGNRLGPVGSRIVAETFVGLIKKSRISILPRDTPGQPIDLNPDLGRKPGQFSMPELLYFVHKSFPSENFINPLGNGQY